VAKPTAEDKWNILELFARYAWAVDTGNEDEFVQQFRPDAAIEEEGDRFEGVDGLRRFFRRFRYLPSFPGRQHWVGQPLINGDREVCSVRSFAMATHLNKGTGSTQITFLGYYTDVVVRADEDTWLFQERVFRRWAGPVLDGFPVWKPIERGAGGTEGAWDPTGGPT